MTFSLCTKPLQWPLTGNNSTGTSHSILFVRRTGRERGRGIERERKREREGEEGERERVGGREG